MSIVAKCPHCETRFNLQQEMNGQSMRCPNFECRQTFTVRALEATAPPKPIPEPPPPPPEPKKVAATKPPKPSPQQPPKQKPKQVVVEAEIVEAAVVSTPKVKEVVWSEGTEAPEAQKPKKKGKKPVAVELVEEEQPLVRRKRPKNRRPLILAGVAIATVALLIFGAVYLIRYEAQKEDRLAKVAEEEYKKGEYAAAAKSYEKLATDFGDSKDGGKYKFFAALSKTQVVVRAVTVREDYAAAMTAYKEFADAHKDSPFAKPTTGFGHDVYDAGKKLCEDIDEHAKDRIKAYTTDPSKTGELDRAEKALADGRALIAVIDPFRGPEDSLDPLKKRFDDTEKALKRARDRAAAIADAKARLESPTDAIIQAVTADLTRAGFLDDPEAQSLLAAAKGKLAALVEYKDDPAEHQPPPPTGAVSLLFVTPVGKDKLRDRAPNDPPAAVFLCVARGVLYALDEDTGKLLWATRVSPDVTDPPPVAQVELPEGRADLAVVTSNVGNVPALTGYVLRSGQLRWYQPLPAPAAGPAVVVGSRAFVPLKDALGTVYEFELSTGARIGRIRLGQTIADRGAALRPGTNLLYVAADARRLYLIDVGGLQDGERVNPRCVQVLGTGHLPGTLRVPPMFIGPEGNDVAERWLVLAQTEGATATQIRAFPIPPGPPPAAPAGAAPPETKATAVATEQIPGWVWFPPAVGEHIAIASDTGQFRLFGVKQPGNIDPKPLYKITVREQDFPAVTGDRTMPGLVIPVEEATYWLVVAGQLRRARLSMASGDGHKVVVSGSEQTVGEPIHRAQLGTRRDVGCLVARSPNSSGCRAVAFDVRSGEIRWQRQLGLVPARTGAEQFAAPIPQGDRFILVDEDGGIMSIPTTVGSAPPQPGESAKWLLAAAPADASGPTSVAAAPDGKVVYTVTPINRKGAKFLIRRVADGKVAQEDEVFAPLGPAGPAGLAGAPAIVGGALLVPTTDGNVNRFVPGAGVVQKAELVPGPAWLGERKPANPVCDITPISATTFATSDGGKKLTRWEWPNAPGAQRNKLGEWELNEQVAGAGLVLPAEGGNPARVLVADITGGLYLFPADRPGQPKRWKPGGASVVPVGRPSSAFVAQAGGEGRVTVAYAVDGKTAAAIDPNRADPLWAARSGDDVNSVIVGAPQPAGTNRWLVTDLTGRVILIDGTTGAPLVTQSVGLPGAVPAAASGVAADIALTPLSDGSAVVVELPRAVGPEAPKKE